jgi:DNA-binding response OmpR family regulator
MASEGPPLRVLLIEDDFDVAAAMMRLLAAARFAAVHAATGAAAKRLVQETRPQIALVDLQLPDTSGVSLVRWLVGEGGCGILVLSGLSDEIDRVTCLELGADDYVVKPPNPRELVARILAVHRRVASALRAPSAGQVTIGEHTIDLAARVMRDAAGRTQELTAAECAVVAMLAAMPGRAVSRDALSLAVLHRSWRADDRSIDQLIFQLRSKLGAGEAGRRLIQSARGEGYLLAINKS